ncbi:MAG: hypothetical protein KA477_01040 [Candidatus Levybacteria bacterium]|nr:hypothetical protein [Candidatus Levybacteria bacterium]
MIEKLQNQLRFLPAISPAEQQTVVCIEAGHIYTDETPSLSHEIGAIVGHNVSQILEGMGVTVQKMLFVDDYNALSHNLNVEEYRSLLNSHGFEPDILVMESSLVQDAYQVIAELEVNSLTETNKNGALILKKNHKKEKDIVLRKSPSMESLPACAALDTALYIKKNERAGICVTVLHEKWKSQQEAVKKVLKALGKDIPILEIFFTDYGEIEIDFDY